VTAPAPSAPLLSIPRLTTARLLLREFQMRDFDAYATNLTDPVATKFTSGLQDRRAAWRSFAAQTGSWLLNGGGWWAVEQREGGAVVGTVGAFFRETDATLVELGCSPPVRARHPWRAASRRPHLCRELRLHRREQTPRDEVREGRRLLRRAGGPVRAHALSAMTRRPFKETTSV
jgi:hypothetical protein